MTIEDGLVTLGVSTISAIIISLVANSQNRKKRNAEIELLKATTKKIKAEMKNLAENVEQEALSSKTMLIYDGSRISASDFDFEQRKNWDETIKALVGENAQGIYEIIDGVMDIKRLNNQGRFTLTLLKYFNRSQISDRIEPYPTSDKERKVRIRCQVRSKENKESMLRFVLKVKNNKEDRWLRHADRPFMDSAWQPVNLIFRIAPDEKPLFKIDVYGSDSPTTIQIKDLIIEEDLN